MPRIVKRKPNKKIRKFKRKAKLTRSVSQATHFFKRWTTISNMALKSYTASVGGFTDSTGYFVCTSAAAAATPAFYSFGLGFQLNDVPNASEFTNLFDKYKLCAVKLRIIPMCNSTENAYSVGGATYRSASGFIHYAIDKDDLTIAAASEAGINVLRQYENYRVATLQTKKIDMYVKPKLLVYANAGGVATAGIVSGGWCDCNTSTYNHYGIKGVIEIMQPFAPAAGIDYYFKVEAKYYIACRSVR